MLMLAGACACASLSVTSELLVRVYKIACVKGEVNIATASYVKILMSPSPPSLAASGQRRFENPVVG